MKEICSCPTDGMPQGVLGPYGTIGAAQYGYVRFPCPFCGSYCGSVYTSAETIYVVCSDCGAAGPPVRWRNDDDMTLAAVHAWNQRSDNGRGS